MPFTIGRSSLELLNFLRTLELPFCNDDHYITTYGVESTIQTTHVVIHTNGTAVLKIIHFMNSKMKFIYLLNIYTSLQMEIQIDNSFKTLQIYLDINANDLTCHPHAWKF